MENITKLRNFVILAGMSMILLIPLTVSASVTSIIPTQPSAYPTYTKWTATNQNCVNASITGTYDYYDNSAPVNTTSVFKWYLHDNGTLFFAINGGTQVQAFGCSAVPDGGTQSLYSTWYVTTDSTGHPTAYSETNPAATPSPSATPVATASPSTAPVVTAAVGGGTTPSDALTSFLNIFFGILKVSATIFLPLLVLTWAVRLTAELLRGR